MAAPFPAKLVQIYGLPPWKPREMADKVNEIQKDHNAYECFSAAGVPPAILSAAEDGKYYAVAVIRNTGNCFGGMSSAEIVKIAQAYLRLCKIEDVTVETENNMIRVDNYSASFLLFFTW